MSNEDNPKWTATRINTISVSIWRLVHRFILKTPNMLGLIAVYLLLGSTYGMQNNLDRVGNGRNLTWTYHVDENHEKLVAFQRKGEDNTIVDCYISGDRIQINGLLEKTPETVLYTVKKDSMETLISICSYGKWKGVFTGENGEDVRKEFGIFSDFFIYPGTKWCGAGNISEEYDDLGPEVDTDMCCRTHDHCNDSISAFGSKYNLENDTPVTKSHCDCDDLFHACLQGANTKTSHRVGRLYFNFLQMDCFRQDYPIKRCKKYRGWVRRRCEEYELDLENELIHQFFDARHYERPSTDEDDDDEDEEYKDVFSYMLHLEHEYEMDRLVENY